MQPPVVAIAVVGLEPASMNNHPVFRFVYNLAVDLGTGVRNENTSIDYLGIFVSFK